MKSMLCTATETRSSNPDDKGFANADWQRHRFTEATAETGSSSAPKENEWKTTVDYGREVSSECFAEVIIAVLSRLAKPR